MRCTGCRELRDVDQFAFEKGRRQARCEQCMQKTVKKRKVEARGAAREGVVCMTSDPRYAGREDERSGGDVLLDAGRLWQVLEAMIALEESEMIVWLTSKEMGYASEAKSAVRCQGRNGRPASCEILERKGRHLSPRTYGQSADAELGLWGANARWHLRSWRPAVA